MVCVDRAVNSVCFDSGDGGFSVLAAEGEGRGVGGEPGCSEGWREGVKFSNKEGRRGREMVECRICQEEGLESDMESPCACCGTLKFAHRKCIQKWCYKKGDITCEICNQVYAPNYSAPPPQTNSDVLAVDIRQTWGARIDLHDSHFLAIAAAEQGLLHVEYEDYTAAHNSGIACCRIVAFILILILYFRQLLMVTSGPLMVQDVPAYFNVSLQFAGFLLPCYVIARSCYLLQRQHRRQSWL